MATDLDSTDRQLLTALLWNGRAAVTDLGEEIGVAASTVTKRLSRLEDSGVIEEFRPTLDYATLGYRVTAVFHLDVATDRAALAADLAATPPLHSVYEVTGSHDVVAIGRFPNTDAMNARIKDLLTDERVRSAATDVVLDIVCEGEQFPLEADAD